jgi:DnaJ-class molecular chaperone
MPTPINKPTPVQRGVDPMKARKAERKCSKCNGDGLYKYGGAIVNGVFTGKVGTCFACEGKGVQTSKDVARCDSYWNHRARW